MHSDDAVIARAIGFRQVFGDERLPVDVDAIALAAGYYIFRFDLGATVNEMFMGETILLDPKVPGEKFLRWLKGHAMGHGGRVGAPRGSNDEWVRLQGPLSRREEAAADLFARHLLIPVEEWLDAELEGRLSGLEDRLRVPSFALRAYAHDIESGLFRPREWASGPIAESQRPYLESLERRIVTEVRDGGDFWVWEVARSVPPKIRRELEDWRDRSRFNQPIYCEIDDRWYRWDGEALEVASAAR
jgi:hypothetical protein